MKKDIFVWEPLSNNSVFKLVKINNHWLSDVLHDVFEINIFQNTVEILKDDDVIVELEVDGDIWTDVLDELHKYLNDYGYDKENVVHVFPVRIGVFSTKLHYEIVEYSKPSWYVTFIDGTKVCIDGIDFVEKGYKIGLSLVNKDEVKPLELYSQVGLAEVLGKSRQNIRYHLEKGNLLNPIALVDGRPVWNKDQVYKMLELKEKGLL